MGKNVQDWTKLKTMGVSNNYQYGLLFQSEILQQMQGVDINCNKKRISLLQHMPSCVLK